MARPALEVADIFRDHGPAWRDANRGHVSLGQLKVMSAIERCRTAALGGHVARCENEACGYTVIAYNSCRNRHCPKCQGSQAREWMAARAAELLPVPYFHVVFTLPSAIGDIAYQNKAVIYDLLFAASAETMLTIAADKKHLGARIGITAVLHTWGSAMTHHPHVHMIVPGGGISRDGSRWVAKRPDFFLPVRVLSKLFRRLMIEKLVAAHAAGQLTFHGAHAALVNTKAFAAYLAPLRRTRWFVYAKRPFAGPKAVLAYLSRYTHRVAISNRRLIAADARAVTFKVKDYDDARCARVHSPVPDPRAAQGLPPHPPLRSAGERREGRQPRARPQAARRRPAGARATGHRFRSGHAPRVVPVLRRGHAHHRGVQGRRVSATQADRDARHQDRHLMSPGSLVRRCCADLSRWSRTGRGSARPSRDPETPRSVRHLRCRATRPSSIAPRNSAIAPYTTSSTPASPPAASKSP
jgi:hypothetical protein